ncbi:MAG: hypothetical protein HOB79_11280 [Rhodospirillaceae bacterium]|nr:hypothetical protein [Rhodospirillales bacterium]MBT3906906.1 hypothetical protein [Rhodospirillaceae bacterium]MBT4701641.1 hypothetical protein [Rhodospirillaceae bacterium]MBT5033295.1 hypothetical protein [Rhodospirillaceae bacterium]MBT6220945.1 hypothetical protein [Rhodospirillaceae bacterium]
MPGSITGMISFSPMFPWPLLAGVAVIAAVLLIVGLVRGGSGIAFRAATLAVLILALMNPKIVNEDRKSQPDIALIVADQSGSQSAGERRAQTDATVKTVADSLSQYKDLETRVIRLDDKKGARKSEAGTRLFSTLEQAMTDVPAERFAGAVIVTDGQIHDVPKDSDRHQPAGPLHVLLTGSRAEKDRRLIVENAPGYGIVGQKVTVVFKVQDRGATSGGGKSTWVKVHRNGVEKESVLVTIGKSLPYTFELEHAGQTLLELEVDPQKDELSTVNNKSVVSINGVRDRLKVLLVSGQPHAGERVWRNLLKSDPAVELVHFTILRTPEENDFTPLRELALISFPVTELFEVKLPEFDLIVFDRYTIRDILSPTYFINIENYLREGGAVMLAVGPGFAGDSSLFLTTFGAVMPGQPTGKVLEQGFRPGFTEKGKRHPVTAPLRNPSGKIDWGRWFRQVDVKAARGTTLLNGVDKKPLLILDRVGKGRVAQLMSDHIWLWSRGFEGGGPHAALLRRLAHWLMKEPDLEEERLTAKVSDDQITIERRSLEVAPPEVTVTSPSGKPRKIELKPAGEGIARAEVTVDESGLFRINDGRLSTLAAVGPSNPLELADLRATDEILAPVARATGGGVNWITDGLPTVRRTKTDKDTSGKGWIGLRRNGAFVVSGVSQIPLMTGFVILVLLLGGLTAAWWREGK